MNNKQVSVPFANCLSLTCKCFFSLSLSLLSTSVYLLCVRSHFNFGLDFFFFVSPSFLNSSLHLFAYCLCAERRFSGTGGGERALAFTHSFREQMNAKTGGIKKTRVSCVLPTNLFESLESTYMQKSFWFSFYFNSVFLNENNKYTFRMWNKFWLAFGIISAFFSGISFVVELFFSSSWFSSSSENTDYCVVTPIFVKCVLSSHGAT